MKKTHFLTIVLCLAGIMPVLAEQPVSGSYFVTAKSGLNIRTEARQNAPVLVSLPEGEMVFFTGTAQPATIAGKQGYWMQVRRNNQEGYAFSPYLEPAPTKDTAFLHEANILEILAVFNRRTRLAEIVFNATPGGYLTGTPDMKFFKDGIHWDYTQPIVNHIHIRFEGKGLTPEVVTAIRAGKVLRFRMTVGRGVRDERRPADGSDYKENHFTVRMQVTAVIRP